MDYFIVELIEGKNLAIPLAKIQEVTSIPYHNICPIPGVHKSLLGIASQRGNLLWLLDLSSLLYNLSTVINKWESLTILIAKFGKNNLGLVVKKLGKIDSFSKDNFSDKEVIIDNLELEYISSLINDELDLFPILNLDRIEKSLQDKV